MSESEYKIHDNNQNKPVWIIMIGGHMNRKRLLRIIFSLIILLLLNNLIIHNTTKAQAATFEDINQDSVFVMQQEKGTCTLASSVMMLRRAAMMNGKSNWDKITEKSLRPIAWLEGTGIYHNYTYEGIKVTVGNIDEKIVKDKKEFYINMLKDHPEGVLIYNFSHGILLTDYTDGQFYCADPAVTPSRVPLSRSKVTIDSAKRYWYVNSTVASLDGNSDGNVVNIDSSILSFNAKEFIYTGQEIKPQITVNSQNQILKQNINYTITYENNINVGNATAIITGKGQFSGSIRQTFAIKAANMKGINMKGYSGNYDGKPHGPIVNIPVGASITYSLNGKDYKEGMPTNMNPGIYKVYYKVTQPNFNSVGGNVTSRITTIPINSMSVTLSSSNYVYNSNARKPSVTLKNGKSVVASSNYTVKYTSNTKPGIASVLITGKGYYSGSKSITFVIRPSSTKITVSSTNKSVSTKWTKVTGASGYEVYMSTVKNSVYSKIGTINSSSTNYKKTKLISKKTYYFKVRAYTKVGSKTVYGDFSNLAQIKVR